MLFCGVHTERTNDAGVGCRGLLGMRAALSVVLWGSHRKDKCGKGRFLSNVEGIIQKGQMWQGLVVQDCYFMRAVLSVFLCGDHREMKNVGKVGF